MDSLIFLPQYTFFKTFPVAGRHQRHMFGRQECMPRIFAAFLAMRGLDF
jgi:hypothetical protein